MTTELQRKQLAKAYDMIGEKMAVLGLQGEHQMVLSQNGLPTELLASLRNDSGVTALQEVNYGTLGISWKNTQHEPEEHATILDFSKR